MCLTNYRFLARAGCQLVGSDKACGGGGAQAKAAEDPAKLVAAALKKINSVPYEKSPNFVPMPFAGLRAYACARTLTHPPINHLSHNLRRTNRVATHSQTLAHTHAHIHTHTAVQQQYLNS